MRAFFSKDSVLKVISAIIAVLMWLYIIIVVDPSVEDTIRDIPVKYTNIDSLSDSGLCIINEDKPTVTIRIRGSRKTIAKIDNKNVYATIDVSNVISPGKVSLPIGLSIPYEYSEIVSKKPYNADVYIDKIAEKEIEINIVKSGEPAKGYVAGVAETTQQKIELKGAASILKNIGSASVSLNYDGRNAEINDTAKIYLIDADGKTIEENSYIYDVINMDITETQVICPVYKSVTVPVKLDTRAYDEGNYKVSISPVNVTVYGPNDKLDEIVEIYTEPIDVNDIVQTGSENVKLVIPDGIMMRDAITDVMVKVELKG